MKSDNQSRDTYFSGSGQSQHMSIQSSAKIVGILVDSMYSDKPKAIYREMISNGWDAQKEAGNEHIPPDVTVPSIFTPKFSYRDYGTGLSHDFMMNQYCVIGHSTKEDSNDAVGKWGLGRLVPLSYTDTYSVTSYRGGTKRFYSIVRSDNGIECVPMGEEPTDEPNGLEVSFPIRKEDTHVFKDALEYISLGLYVKPRVLGISDYKWPEVPVLIKGDGWQYINRAALPYGSPLRDRAHVRMGCVLYPVSNTLTGFTEPVILEAPIGSLAVTASRESLSYGKNEPTTETITKLMNKFMEDIVGESVKKVKESKTYLEAWNTYQHAYTSLRGEFLKRFIDGVGEKWRGYNLARGYLFTFGEALSWGDIDYNRVQVTKSLRSAYNNYGPITKGDLAAVVENISVGERDVRGPKRILNWWREFDHDKRPRYLVWFQYDKDDPLTSEAIIKFMCQYPEVPIYTVFEHCPDVPPLKKDSKPVQIKKQETSRRTIDQYTWSNYDMSPEEFEKGGYYQKTENNELRFGDQPTTVRWYEYAFLLGELKDFNLFVVPKTHWKRFEEAPQWKEVEPKLKSLVLAHREGFIKAAKTYSSFTPPSYLNNYRTCDKLIDWLCSHTFESYKGFQCSSCLAAVQFLGINTDNFDQGPKRKETYEKVMKKYPLLKYADGYRVNVEEFKEYIKQVQKLEEKANAKV